MHSTASTRPLAGIAFIIAGMVAISINDMLIKAMSDGYPLHQIVFIRSAIGILFSLAVMQFEGGFHLLKTRRPGLHALRGLLVVMSNMCYFVALAVMPLADATALFFVAPFEYVGLPMAVLWGWLFWAELPALPIWIGIALIAGSGLFVFLREKQNARRVARVAEVKGRY